MVALLKQTVEINCSKPIWKAEVKTALQEKRNVKLVNMDYTEHGQFCETLSIAHSVPFRIDHKHGFGFFTWPK